MKAVTIYSKHYTGQDICLDPDPNTPPIFWKQHPMIQHIYDYQKKFKGKQKKMDPLTKRMLLHMIERAQYLKRTNPDCLELAIIDWLILSLTTGFRGIEWCQEKDPSQHGFTMYSQPVEHTTNMIYAFCIGDWKFFTVARVEISHYLSCDPSSVRTVSINYRF